MSGLNHCISYIQLGNLCTTFEVRRTRRKCFRAKQAFLAADYRVGSGMSFAQIKSRRGSTREIAPSSSANANRVEIMSLFSKLQYFWSVAKDSVVAWMDDYAPSMGAALAFYTFFSIGPLLIIVIAVAGLVFGEAAAQGEVVAQLRQLLGEEGAIAVQGMFKSVSDPSQGIIATLVSIAMLLLGATTVLAELQSALDRIWKAPALKEPGSVWSLISMRIWALGMVLGLGFLLLVSLLASAALAALGKWWAGWFGGWQVKLQGINFFVSFGLITTAFAMIYKLPPRVRIAWRDVWIGAALTALLFTLGKFLIGIYLGRSSIASGFGAAGSLVILLLWVYYSAQIFLLGAEFTKVSAQRRGSHSAAAKITVSKNNPRRADLTQRVSSADAQTNSFQPMSFNRLAVLFGIGLLGAAIGRRLAKPAKPLEAYWRRQ